MTADNADNADDADDNVHIPTSDDVGINSLDCLVLATIFFWLWVCGGLAFLAQRLNWIGGG